MYIDGKKKELHGYTEKKNTAGSITKKEVYKDVDNTVAANAPMKYNSEGIILKLEYYYYITKTRE